VRSIAFFPVPHLHIPHNNREIYLSRELERRGWQVYWLRPRSGTNAGVKVEWPEITFPDLDVRGRKYILPVLLAVRLRAMGVKTLWLSGWNIRNVQELKWMVRILTVTGIRVIYDPIDPICEFVAAQEGRESRDRSPCNELLNQVYSWCSLVVCVTPEIRELLISHGAPADRLIVGRWGTDGDLFDQSKSTTELKEHLGLSQDTFLVGWLGTMELFKGLQEVVLPLIESVAGSNPSVHFVLAGRGTLEPTVRAWASERPHVSLTVLPSIEYSEAPAFTGSLDAYLVPTNPVSAFARAICPVKVFDALAMGVPLLVTRTPATEFLEEHGGLVSLVDFGLEPFRVALLERIEACRTEGRARSGSPVRAYTHQRVSCQLADAISRIAE